MKKIVKIFSLMLMSISILGCDNQVQNSSNVNSSQNSDYSSFDSNQSDSSIYDSISEIVDPSFDTLEEVSKMEVGSSLKVKCVVNAVKGNGLYVSDHTGYFFVYTTAIAQIGDVIEIEGTLSRYAAADILQIVPNQLNVVGRGIVEEPCVINRIEDIDFYRFAPITLNGLTISQKSINTGSDSKITVTLGGKSTLLFIHKSCADKANIDKLFNNLAVGTEISVVGGFADYFKSPQIVITHSSQIEQKNLSESEKLSIILEEMDSYLNSIENQSFKRNLSLPTELSFQAKVNWTSSNPTYCSNDGVITRPEVNHEDVIVLLSYTITFNNKVTNGRSVSITILAKQDNEQDYDYTYVEPSYAGNYYTSIDEDLRGTELTIALKSLLESTSHPNVTFSYKGLFEIFQYTDAYPNKPGYITSFYSGTAALKSSMNREHVWPNSRGGGFIDSDPHMTRPTLTSENSARGNSFFNENASWDPASFNNEKYRGIAARIIFYCAVKKYGTLKLVDLASDSPDNNSMGKLSTLLIWNLKYDIDDSELLRNDVLFEKYNHCRNPFIDDRNYACRIWGTTNAATKQACGMN